MKRRVFFLVVLSPVSSSLTAADVCTRTEVNQFLREVAVRQSLQPSVARSWDMLALRSKVFYCRLLDTYTELDRTGWHPGITSVGAKRAVAETDSAFRWVGKALKELKSLV